MQHFVTSRRNISLRENGRLENILEMSKAFVDIFLIALAKYISKKINSFPLKASSKSFRSQNNIIDKEKRTFWKSTETQENFMVPLPPSEAYP